MFFFQFKNKKMVKFNIFNLKKLFQITCLWRKYIRGYSSLKALRNLVILMISNNILIELFLINKKTKVLSYYDKKTEKEKYLFTVNFVKATQVLLISILLLALKFFLNSKILCAKIVKKIFFLSFDPILNLWFKSLINLVKIINVYNQVNI